MTDTPTADRPTPNRTSTRRGLLAAGGATLAALAGCTGGGDPDPSGPYGWVEVSTPAGGALYDVTMTVAGPHAVGEGGRIIARREDSWASADGGGVTDTLNAADSTGDGRRFWAAGSSGALVRHDVTGGGPTDHSAPEGKTSSWSDVAVAGPTGSERLALVNSSGELLAGSFDDGSFDWDPVTKPTGGESASAVDLAMSTGFVADTAGNVYREKGDSWRLVGVQGLTTNVTDLSAVGPELVDVVADDGSILQYTGYNWYRLTDADNALQAIDRRGKRGVAVGVEGSAYGIEDDGWTAEDTPTSDAMHGVALGSGSYSDVAVGANGTVLERFG